MTDEPQDRTLGKYQILGELGRGAFATVYRARDSGLRREVALKVLHPALLADPAFVTRFENDARAAAQLDHPHIVTVHDLGQLEGQLFIDTQLLPGGSLAERIESQGPLALQEAARVIEEVADALDHAHAAGFVHRDIKPSNILFNARGQAVVTDFGLVKAAEHSMLARSTAGGVVGTPAYIAPEVWKDKETGPATDVYSLGCVLFEMLTGERMFQGDSSPAVMMAHFEPHQYPEEWPEGVPPAIEGLLERALAADPAARYPGPGALAADLKVLAARAADPLALPYGALEAALAAENWEQASQFAQEIMGQDTDYRHVQALARQAAEGQSAAEQGRWAAQWREQALAAERAGKLDAARVAAGRWLEMAPDDAGARALLDRLEAARPKAAEAAPSPASARPARPDREGVPVGQPKRPATVKIHVALLGLVIAGCGVMAVQALLHLSQGAGNHSVELGPGARAVQAILFFALLRSPMLVMELLHLSPGYYSVELALGAMAVPFFFLARGLWRLRNWARIVTLINLGLWWLTVLIHLLMILDSLAHERVPLISLIICITIPWGLAYFTYWFAANRRYFS